ncbi:MBL fold metallo-hydrolase [Acidobacteriota bacterium]
MQTMKPIRICALFLVLCLSFSGAQEEMPDLNNVEILTTHIAGNVYMLEATGDVAGNIAVSAGPDGLLLVDTQFAPLATKTREALSKINQGQIKYIINTHHHDDHTHGNSVLGRSATIISHSNARKRLIKSQRNPFPHLTFEKQLTIHFNGEDITIVHYPRGHSDSDVVVTFTKSNVVHTGDLWNSGTSSFPIVDLDAGGSIYGILHNVERLIDSIPEGAKIIPGHYAPSDLFDLKRTRNMLAETIEIVHSKKSKGKSLDQIKTEGFPPKYESWGTAYTKASSWIENIYQGLEKDRITKDS